MCPCTMFLDFYPKCHTEISPELKTQSSILQVTLICLTVQRLEKKQHLYEKNSFNERIFKWRNTSALRIGAPVCEPDVCRCGANVNTLGLHNLVCRLSAGRLNRHVDLNDVVEWALQTSGVTCLLESPGLSREDGRKQDVRKPDDITMFVYKHGTPLCWYCSFAPIHVNESAVQLSQL